MSIWRAITVAVAASACGATENLAPELALPERVAEPRLELPENLGRRVTVVGVVRAVHTSKILEIARPCCGAEPMLVLAETAVRFGDAGVQTGDPVIVEGVVRWMSDGVLERMLGYEIPAPLHARFDETGVLDAYEVRDASGLTVLVAPERHRRDRTRTEPRRERLLVATQGSGPPKEVAAADPIEPWEPAPADRDTALSASTDALAPDRVRRPRRFDLTVSAGAGVDGFLGAGLRGATSVAPAVDLRVLLARGRYGVELGYVGTAGTIASSDPATEALLVGTTVEALGHVRLRDAGRLQPYVVGGVAYRWFAVDGEPRRGTTPDSDDLLALAVGAGVQLALEHVRADLRVTFRPAIDPAEVASRTSAGAAAAIGWRF